MGGFEKFPADHQVVTVLTVTIAHRADGVADEWHGRGVADVVGVRVRLGQHLRGGEAGRVRRCAGVVAENFFHGGHRSIDCGVDHEAGPRGVVDVFGADNELAGAQVGQFTGVEVAEHRTEARMGGEQDDR